MEHGDCCLNALWKDALDNALSNPVIKARVELQKRLDPTNITPELFFRQSAWRIYVSGIRPDVIEKKWLAIEEAFLHWNYQEVYLSKMAVRTRAMRIIDNLHKAEAVNYVAEWIYRVGWKNIKKYLVYNLKKDGTGNFIPDPGVIPYLDFLPMIGEVNAIHILRDLGYDLAAPDAKFKSLAARFGYSPDMQGVQQFANNISTASGERVSFIETVLRYADASGILASFRCPDCGKHF